MYASPLTLRPRRAFFLSIVGRLTGINRKLRCALLSHIPHNELSEQVFRPKTQDLLKALLGVEFKDSIAQADKFIRRKGVALYLQQWFEQDNH